MKKAIIKINGVLPDTGENINLFLLTNRENVKETPELISELKEMMKEISFDKPVSIKNIFARYSLVEKMKDIPFGNTLIEVNIPYCLHIPNGYEVKINLSNLNLVAHIIFYKVWKKNAENSNDIDIYAEDKITCFKNSNVITSKIPHVKSSGFDFELTGKNLEKIKDSSGYFRYTKMKIFISTDYEEEDFKKDDGEEKIKDEIYDKIFKIINRVVDAYRHTTGEEHIERLNFLTITNIYFLDHDVGIYPVDMWITSATINRSAREIEKFKDILSKDIKIPLHELLLLDSKSHFNKKIYTLSVVTSFQALEIFLENFLVNAYRRKKYSEQEIGKKLKQEWRTKERLKKLLKETTGYSLSENKNLWDDWCDIYDKTRKKVIHYGKDADEKETRKTLRICSEIIKRIKSL